jgi:hypothetical protein
MMIDEAWVKIGRDWFSTIILISSFKMYMFSFFFFPFNSIFCFFHSCHLFIAWTKALVTHFHRSTIEIIYSKTN